MMTDDYVPNKKQAQIKSKTDKAAAPDKPEKQKDVTKMTLLERLSMKSKSFLI
jgi:hypothetical protein